ncbi:Dachshund -like protein 1 [Collichthys lucidus]|uniref:Dachshund-like protein 1 n=1 Tax=Collichthys lucidus TaxID=240159 RepID=A0A4V6XYE1_COLLU|nr:Dachshund -like protein 1 [Collichthys lucidus]
MLAVWDGIAFWSAPNVNTLPPLPPPPPPTQPSSSSSSSSSSLTHSPFFSVPGVFSSRPGRPPKRTQSVTSPENPHIMPHSVPGLMSPGMMPPTGLTAAAAAAANAAIAEAMKVKKIKLEAMSGYHSNANHHGADGENGDLGSSVGEDTHTHINRRHIQTMLCACKDTLRFRLSQFSHKMSYLNS